jgi:hypothetical protein
MLKSILKGFKWLFTLPDESKTKINRKMNHAHLKPIAQPVVNAKMPPASKSVRDVMLTTIVYSNINDVTPENVMEKIKGEIGRGHGITQEHKEHILFSCGFQKTHLVNGIREFDPALLHVVNYSMNVMSSMASAEVDKIMQGNSPLEKTLSK